MVKESTRPGQESNQDSSRMYSLVVYNDDVNTFEHVIDTLIEVCEHDPVQAEQCTTIIHYKGKCAVKSGSKDELRLIKDKIHARNVKAKVE